MALPQVPLPVKLFSAVIFSDGEVLRQAKARLIRKFGPIDFESRELPFENTAYYEEEMGQGLKRQFIAFARLIPPLKLASAKRYTNRLEAYFAKAGGEKKRPVNLDPGYLSCAKMVLASCKNYAHRIYIGKGVFAEITLQYRGKSFISMPWTYPDYATHSNIETFNTIREICAQQIREMR